MHSSLFLLLWGGASAVVFYLLSSIVSHFRHAAKAKSLGCEPPPKWPGGGFLGINHLKQMNEADKAGTLVDFVMDRHFNLSKQWGRPATTFRYSLLGTEIIKTNDPKNIQAVLAVQFKDFGHGPSRRGIMMPLLGDGIFHQDGEKWEHSRAMLRPNFVRDQISDLSLSERHINHLMKALPVPLGNDGWTPVVDLQTLFFRFTIDSATEFLFGHSINSQLIAADPDYVSPNDPSVTNEKVFAAAFDSGQRHVAQRFRLADKYWLHNPKEFQDNIKDVNRFVDHFVAIALQAPADEKSAEEGKAKEKYVFLDALAKQTRDPIELRAQLLNILLAGRDTTASLLSYVFFHLVRRPDVYAKLRQAVLHDFGSYADPQNLSFASLKGCAYLQWIINETLRLNTVVPGNGRTALKDTTLPNGGGADGTKPIYMKKGTIIEYWIHVMHRRPDIWGPDAQEWKPERWEGKRPGWEYLPFNGGPRICIGQQFAIIEASYVIVRLLQRFDRIEAAEDELTRPVTANVTLTACPGKGPVVRLHEATN